LFCVAKIRRLEINLNYLLTLSVKQQQKMLSIANSIVFYIFILAIIGETLGQSPGFRDEISLAVINGVKRELKVSLKTNCSGISSPELVDQEVVSA
jgi:hypothetical protein